MVLIFLAETQHSEQTTSALERLIQFSTEARNGPPNLKTSNNQIKGSNEVKMCFKKEKKKLSSEKFTLTILIVVLCSAFKAIT
jgi:hypothetical protein